MNGPLGFSPSQPLLSRWGVRFRGCKDILPCPLSTGCPVPLTVLGPGPLGPCPSPLRPQLTWWRGRTPGPADPGGPSTDPCCPVLGTCPLAASLAPGVGHWPGERRSETLCGLPTLDHTWLCAAPVGFKQSWITMAQPGRLSLERRWDGGVLMATP